MVTSYLSEGDAAAIDGEFANMRATFQVLRDPPPVVIVRQDGVTVGTFQPASIRFASRQAAATGAGTPVATTELDGTLTLWATDIVGKPVRRGDRFIWNGQACVIATPPRQRLGKVVSYDFRLEGRNP